MKVVLGLVGVAVIAAAAWFVFFSPSNDYEVIVIDEVEQLEEELAALEVAVRAGTLSEEQANQARERIATRLAQITTNTSAANDAKLTAGQKLQLQTGLRQLQDVLVRYQSTLVAVDAKSTTRSSGGSSKSIVSQFVEAIGLVENTVDEVVEEYTEDLTVSNAIEAIDESTPDTVEEIVEAADEVVDDMTTDDSEDAATSTEDVMVEDVDSEDDSTDVEIEIESETTVSSDEEEVQ